MFIEKGWVVRVVRPRMGRMFSRLQFYKHLNPSDSWLFFISFFIDI